MATSWWTMTDDGCRVTDDVFQAGYDLAGGRTFVRCLRPWGNPSDAILAQWDAEAPAKLAEMAPERIAKQRYERAMAGAIKARFGGVCAASGKRYERGAMIKRWGNGWALALATMAPAAPVNDEFADDEPTVADDARLVAREMAMEVG